MTTLTDRPSGPGAPTAPQHSGGRPFLARQSVVTGLIGAVAGYFIGHWLGNYVGHTWINVINANQNDLALLLGYVMGVLGWLAGLGAFNYPLQKMVGIEPIEDPAEAEQGLGRYFRYTTEHKVVGVQYLFGILIYFFTAGLLAIAMRTELLSPTQHVFGPGAYIEIVGEHGTMMMMMMTSVITGPFGNYFLPIMIGSRRTAFPRLEALSFWLTPCAYIVLLSSLLMGGFPSGWTGYAPLSIQAGPGMDAYIIAFGLMGLSMIINGLNLIVTVVNYRAPGMTFSRLPLFVWSVVATAFLMTLAAPVLLAGLYLMAMDRTALTAFFVEQHGGSSYLWENVFWFFGHPEVYILALPGFGVVFEILPVFCRKPAFGYKVSVAGMIGVSTLSFFVWQHHLFDSGMNPAMRPVVMLTTELISIPTGFIYLAALGTMWRARMRLDVPVLFCIGMLFNFLIGGVSGVFLSDVPADVTAHGSFFVMAHFHYTIMGGLIFAAFGAIYFWLPKMTGRMLNQRAGKIHFWTMFIFFNSTFLPLFAVGELGQPRRVFTYARDLQTLNDWVSISAFLLGGSMLIFIGNFLWNVVIDPKPAPIDPWFSRGLEWHVPSPPPPDNFPRTPLVLSGPYEYGVPGAPPVAVIPTGPPTRQDAVVVAQAGGI
jgi:cytochrome c oxidase subunit 1